MSIPYSSVPSEYIILNLLYYQNTLHIISQRESKKKKKHFKTFFPAYQIYLQSEKIPRKIYIHA